MNKKVYLLVKIKDNTQKITIKKTNKKFVNYYYYIRIPYLVNMCLVNYKKLITYFSCKEKIKKAFKEDVREKSQPLSSPAQVRCGRLYERVMNAFILSKH